MRALRPRLGRLRLRVRTSAMNLLGVSPVVVYQMGKVGSTAIVHTLERAHVRHPVYHVHFLTHDGIRVEEQRYLEGGGHNTRRSGHVRVSKRLRKRLDAGRREPWHLITIVREPVSRAVSSFFEVAERDYPHVFDADGQFVEVEVLRHLRRELGRMDPATEFACTWFDVEMKAVFGLDVFEHPFDKERGYQIIERGDIRLLILRQEDLSDTFPAAIQEFLGLDRPLELRRRNVGTSQPYGDLYKRIKRQLHVSEEVCERVWASRYVRHFYPERMIEDFARRLAAPVGSIQQ